MVWQYFVLTPLGLAGPYKCKEDAEMAAKPLGWKVVRRKAA